MGEIAELMVNGDICGGCGVTLRGASEGYPRYCKLCASAAQITVEKTAKTKCPICLRVVKATGLADHTRVMHRSQP